MLETGNTSGSRKAGSSHAPEYARRLYEEALAWYHAAETKAQVILTLDGMLLGAFAG